MSLKIDMMEIQYLTKMKNNPKVGRFENEGISEVEIEKLEQWFTIKFPQAYKEFLYLGGKTEQIIDGWSSEAKYLNWRQQNIKESMESIDLKLRPYFAFADFNGSNCFFFFIGEGDNPSIYKYDENKIYTNENGDEIYYKKTEDSFSDFIDSFIDYALSNK
ncbi:SMI1/KNR4 family protein [Sphingobacterium sp. SRCM116780]|uniref:SMI1/KNR4 family protein n=1 Tax=Sphingobacterium sp. SRCM116780 TaxID=2907623 RepID=UPI001F1EFDEA|nr:SMI1/KNR4 family protein [Sphingobacterium sp. SRCM116780]UIR57864.1 SMI1/KNR4 family protein [Sphingobacterium sp. SRCM116780]